MSNNCHVINFQNLKKFFSKISNNNGNTRLYNKFSTVNGNNGKIEDSKVFGSAYHKILEQDKETIKKLYKSSSISELNKIVGNYNLSIMEKNILLQMTKKIYQNDFYQRAICSAKYIHKEQNLCHFMTKNQYVFRLEAIIDGIISINGKSQVIIDYKTVNSLRIVEKHINENFYWMQLLFYKYIYENSVKSSGSNAIFDLILFFQSKNNHDDYEIIVKKFSDLPKHLQREYEDNFSDGLQRYIEHFCKHGRSEKQTKNSINLKDGLSLQRKKKISPLKNAIKISIKSSVAGVVGAILFLFEQSQNLIGNEKIFFLLIIFFVVLALWFIFKE